ncbi:xylosyltransferase oxt [Scaptodrosophila lebanonensis]|uniref:protein xylosyltransferase n=1 Tax=Drosophila lebanonensis TaxID=7225 RepID=A0A6J2TAY4_DROLE|nr:xylosyltransferase oxt [Scaptodrosophila lebanonensis]
MEHLSVRWLRRYRSFFIVILMIIAIQVFLAYKSLDIANVDFVNPLRKRDVAAVSKSASAPTHSATEASVEQAASVKEDQEQQQQKPPVPVKSQPKLSIKQLELGFEPECDINAKEAISALQRAKTKDCRQHIAHIACAIQAGRFYATKLRSGCPAGNYTANVSLGCYRDEKDHRLLGGYFVSFKTYNSPSRCVELCLQSGYPYAGVQYGRECFCGFDAPPTATKLPDSSCNNKCLANAKEICGGYFAMNVYETGIAKFTAQVAASTAAPDVERVRIAFLLTLNGRALRQVHRLIKALYAPNHVYYIHVDARQDYLYRKLLELEPKFPNIRLARTRFSTIWGGASLLTMLLHCMQDLLKSSAEWDFVINLSESDFPVKTLDKLEDFLTANRGRNFVKSHGRETQRFIQKQGLDKTFVECDTHMWRIGDRKLPAGIQVDGGSDWVALSRPFVAYVTHPEAAGAERELLDALLVIFRHTLLPAESFFHTVLRNTPHCDTYVDNNLHVTNWKRKLGCKCQYKHVVDWCGCSPNDFKPEDWARLQSTEQKQLFFARKFEPIINQAVLLQLEEWLFGPYTSEYANLHGYWQSLYHSEDEHGKHDDLARTLGDSLMRLAARQFQLTSSLQLHELTHYLHRDQYKGFLVRYSARRSNSTQLLKLETRVRPVQFGKVAKNSRFSKRLRNFEVSTDFDQKEQVARNFAKLLGPYSELLLSYMHLGVASQDTSHSYNLTLLWVDPLGRLQDFNELHIEEAQSDVINHSKTLLKAPLTPGIWTAKLIGRTSIYAQVKFLVTPLAYHKGVPVASEQLARQLNGGMGVALPADFEVPTEWLQHLSSAKERDALQQEAVANAGRFAESLQNWIDELVGKFFQLRETCGISMVATQLSNAALSKLPLCSDTAWSSMAPDPKSDVEALLKRR